MFGRAVRCLGEVDLEQVSQGGLVRFRFKITIQWVKREEGGGANSTIFKTHPFGNPPFYIVMTFETITQYKKKLFFIFIFFLFISFWQHAVTVLVA